MIYPFSRLRSTVNGFLRPFNLRMEALTAEYIEKKRIEALQKQGYFDGPSFPVPNGFQSDAYQTILADLPKYKNRFDNFCDSAANDVGYTYDNGFFKSPDVEVLYTLLMVHRPPHLLEIGCGNSTRVIRQAIRDGGWACHLTCIDPRPSQLDVAGLADDLRLSPVECQRLTANWPVCCVRATASSSTRATYAPRAATWPSLYLRPASSAVLPASSSTSMISFCRMTIPFRSPPGTAATGASSIWSSCS